MKHQKLIYILLACMLASQSSCDKNFEEINTNPVLVTSIDPAFTFANAQRTSTIPVYIFENEIVQQIHSPFTGTPSGGNLNVENDASSSSTWSNLYTGPVKLLADVIDKTKGDQANANLYNMARIWRAYVFQILVDTFGDVPYSEAGSAYLSGLFLPKYDSSTDIYNDIIKELTEATKALDPAKPVIANDLFYKGDISKWKKLGNSLLLRVSMRLSKVNPSKAAEGVKVATNPANGGLISSNSENALLAFNSTYNNPTVQFLHSERANMYVGEPFLNYLKSTNDPRLIGIAVKYEIPANNITTAGAGDTDPNNQQGMPYGYNDATISTAPGFPGKIGTAWKYSQVNRRTVGKLDAPAFFVTFSQTQLLLAEAALRGWIIGDVVSLYYSGVRAHMDQMEQYDVTAKITSSSQDNYLLQNPFILSKGLEQINTQYWISSFLNGHEVWANFRRSGFPSLVPNSYAAADPAVKGGFIRRLPYPSREAAVNPSNLNAAIANMGPNNLATRIFWDK